MATRETFLPFASVEQADRESRALRDIAVLLGAVEEWDDAPGMLETIASIIHHNAQLPDPSSAGNIAAYRDHAWW